MDAEGLLLSWFDLTARYGFRERHSNVYYNLDIRPMLFPLEFADDPAMQARAAWSSTCSSSTWRRTPSAARSA